MSTKIGGEADISRRPIRLMEIPVYFPFVMFGLTKSFDDTKVVIKKGIDLLYCTGNTIN